ncbi:MAG: hypothetical protein WBX15_17815, partial [Thermoanaerobaculia bacterium]
MTPLVISLASLIATMLLNGIVALLVYSIRTTLRQEKLEVANALLQLQGQLARDIREEYATREQLGEVRQRIDLADQMRDGFAGVHRALKRERT